MTKDSIGSGMSVQLLVTMRGEFARRYLATGTAIALRDLAPRVSTARMIGDPGYSMRIRVDEKEEALLREALDANFLVEPDYSMQTFGRVGSRSKGRAVRRRA